MTTAPTTPPVWKATPVSDHVRRVELLISNLLRIGVGLSIALIALGTAVSFVHHPAYYKSSAELKPLVQPVAPFPHSLRGVAAGLRQFEGQAIVALGLLVLIATPVMRVLVSVIAFIQEHDRLYTFITLTVFCLLMLALLLGAVES
ncbi:MAG TPA: DUF1634 domain-containing protein [Lacipirellulaceae bacterium]|nr:DUF1634 domain-containing protein [Lacipirellulaceae bacterium]